MTNFSKFHDIDLDCGYALPGGSRSAAWVLSEIIGLYCNIGKVAGIILVLLYFIGIDLTSSVVVVGFPVVVAGLIKILRINEALANVLPLAMSNVFHLGEIISVSRCGSKPGDNPSESLTGFVEGVTWGHVVVRDFHRKQVFH